MMSAVNPNPKRTMLPVENCGHRAHPSKPQKATGEAHPEFGFTVTGSGHVGHEPVTGPTQVTHEAQHEAAERNIVWIPCLRESNVPQESKLRTKAEKWTIKPRTFAPCVFRASPSCSLPGTAFVSAFGALGAKSRLHSPFEYGT